MKIINYNKSLQSKLDIGIHNYIFYDLYKQINEDKKDIKYIKCNTIFNSLKIITNKNILEIILTDLFKDFNKKYLNKIYIKFFIEEPLTFEHFKFLMSIEPAIKFILLFSPGYLTSYDGKDSNIRNQLIKKQNTL